MRDDLSPAARKLIELCDHSGEVAEVLKANPELTTGLDEYLKWRDNKHVDIEEKKEVSSTAHSLRKISQALPRPAKREAKKQKK